MKTILYVQIDAYKQVKTILLLRLASRFLSPTQNYLIIGNNSPSITQKIYLQQVQIFCSILLLVSYCHSGVYNRFNRRRDRRATAKCLLSIGNPYSYTLLPHRSDYITLVMSRVAALYMHTCVNTPSLNYTYIC